MTIADLIKSIVDSSKERMKSPIAGAYFLAFIIYNWRPLLFLIFSKETIEDKIVVINNVYCHKEAILWPVLMAFGYTIVIPYLMMIVDSASAFAKAKRKKTAYNEKSTELDLKLDIVGKELELQDKQSRNKEKEDLMNEIEFLKIENNANIASAKTAQELLQTQSEEFNSKLKQLKDKDKGDAELYRSQATVLYDLLNNNSLGEAKKYFSPENIERFNMILQYLNPDQIVEFQKIKFTNGKVNIAKMPQDLSHRLEEAGVLFYDNERRVALLTELGQSFLEFISRS